MKLLLALILFVMLMTSMSRVTCVTVGEKTKITSCRLGGDFQRMLKELPEDDQDAFYGEETSRMLSTGSVELRAGDGVVRQAAAGNQP